MSTKQCMKRFSLIRQQSVVSQTPSDEHPWRKTVHDAGVPSPFLGCACLGQASEWHQWEYYNGFAGRKKAVCSGKRLALCCCIGRVLGSWTGPPMGHLFSCELTWWSWRWRVCGERESHRGWVRCSGWGPVQDPHCGSECARPWCKTEVCGEGSKVELSQDCRLRVQESGMYPLIRNRETENQQLLHLIIHPLSNVKVNMTLKDAIYFLNTHYHSYYAWFIQKVHLHVIPKRTTVFSDDITNFSPWTITFWQCPFSIYIQPIPNE